MPIAFIGSCLLMWFDYKYIFPLEWEYTNRQNDMKVQMDKVEEQLKRIEYKLSDLQDRT
jgi:hypothetical protein